MKRSRAHQIGVEVLVGFFMFLVLGALGFITIILSYDNIFTKSYTLQVVFDDVSGLIRGDKVYVHGVDVGRVREMRIDADGVVVDLTLKYEVHLREDYAITVEASSVLGGKYVSIQEGTESAPHLPLDSRVVGRGPIDFIAEASEALEALRSSLEEGGVLKNVEEAIANINEITEGLKEGKGTIGKLLHDEKVYHDLEALTGNLKSISERLENGEGSLGKLLADDAAYDNIVAISEDFKEVSGRLARGEGTMGRLFSSDDKLYEDLSGAVESLNDMLAKVNSGEGTLGRIVQDDELYEELKNALVEVRAMVDDLRETSPVVSFTSIFFGAF